MSAPQPVPHEFAPMPYSTARRWAILRPATAGRGVVRALLVELDARADRLADAAAERAELVRELAHVTGERDAALLALDSPTRSEV